MNKPLWGQIPGGELLDVSPAPVAKIGPASLEHTDIAAWDALGTRFADLCLDQTGSYSAAHWGETAVEPVVFKDQTGVIGGACVLARKVPFLNTGVAVVKWGPVWRERGQKPVPARLHAIIQAMVEEYCTRRGMHLTILPTADPDFAQSTCECLEALGFKQGNAFASPDRYLVNTSLKPDELLASLGQKFRYNLRKALKNQFEIRFADEPAAISEFLDLYRQMIARKQFADHSAIDDLEMLMRTAPVPVRPKIVLASHEGSVTAGGVFWTAGETALYMFGATDDRALRLKAGYAMHWWVAERLCADTRVTRYDLGGNEMDAGLHQFKKGFVGKQGWIAAAPPAYHFAASPLAQLTGAAVFTLKDLKRQVSDRMHSLKQRLAR